MAPGVAVDLNVTPLICSHPQLNRLGYHVRGPLAALLSPTAAKPCRYRVLNTVRSSTCFRLYCGIFRDIDMQDRHNRRNI
jgi:hypothetical protein